MTEAEQEAFGMAAKALADKMIDCIKTDNPALIAVAVGIVVGCVAKSADNPKAVIATIQNTVEGIFSGELLAN